MGSLGFVKEKQGLLTFLKGALDEGDFTRIPCPDGDQVFSLRCSRYSSTVMFRSWDIWPSWL